MREPAECMGKLDCGWFYFKDVAKEIIYIYIIPVYCGSTRDWDGMESGASQLSRNS